MKTKLVLLASLAILGIASYLVSNLSAQGPAPQPGASAPAATKVGLVNMAAILKGYNKVRVYKDQMDKWREPYDKKDKELRKSLSDWQAYASKPDLTTDKRLEAEKTLKDIKRLLEDNQELANKELGKKGEEQMVQMYREFETAVAKYAQSNGFHMIFHFSEPLSEADKYVAPNIQRKLVNPANAGSVCPVYWASGLEVTGDVLNTLNTLYPAAAGAPAAAPATTGPGGLQPKEALGEPGASATGERAKRFSLFLRGSMPSARQTQRKEAPP